MTLEWFKNPDHVTYVERERFVDNFAKETGIPDLGRRITEFELAPEKDGVVIRGNKRTALRLLIPNLMFDADMDMGDNVWIYIGEYYPAYCIYDDPK
jgi:hypothetical protein